MQEAHEHIHHPGVHEHRGHSGHHEHSHSGHHVHHGIGCACCCGAGVRLELDNARSKQIDEGFIDEFTRRAKERLTIDVDDDDGRSVKEKNKMKKQARRGSLFLRADRATI